MQVVYSIELVVHLDGREYRGPRHFLAPVPGATKVSSPAAGRTWCVPARRLMFPLLLSRRCGTLIASPVQPRRVRAFSSALDPRCSATEQGGAQPSS